MGHADIADVVEAFAAAARNAVAAGFEVAEVNGAHGYLINSFLSPMSNHRNDAYGGDRTGRMRFACEVTEAVRAAWPDDKPLFFRVSAIDGVDIGWNMDDTVALARELKTLGVDVIDCSSGGVAESVPMIQRLARGPAFQVPFADQVRREAGIMSMAVGMITEAEQAEAILREDRTDLIAIARELMSNPNWPLHAAEALGVEKPFDLHPEQYGWWLELRARRMAGQS
jgi:2,4-dienoyl-CoA reductase-like NADH-dependent reductase (Old Yellow Enzyme family)